MERKRGVYIGWGVGRQGGRQGGGPQHLPALALCRSQDPPPRDRAGHSGEHRSENRDAPHM